jgi:hypothetical protein
LAEFKDFFTTETPKQYLPEATDFTDIDVRFPMEAREGYVMVPCPLCKGHGMWNLELNAYGPGRHFQQGCRQCWSWGYVEKGSLDETCLHEMVEISRPPNHRSGEHVDQCTKCGRKRSYDTSD